MLSWSSACVGAGRRWGGSSYYSRSRLSGARLNLVPGLQLRPQRLDHAIDGCDVLDRQPIRQIVDPGRLQLHRRVEGTLSFLRQHDELRPPVMRVGLEGDQTFFLQVVDDALHVLAVGAEVAR